MTLGLSGSIPSVESLASYHPLNVYPVTVDAVNVTGVPGGIVSDAVDPLDADEGVYPVADNVMTAVDGVVGATLDTTMSDMN